MIDYRDDFMVINFKAAKNKKEGNITPAVLRDTMDKWIDDYDKLENMIVIYKDEKGDIYTASTNMNHTEALGLLEIAKSIVLDNMG